MTSSQGSIHTSFREHWPVLLRGLVLTSLYLLLLISDGPVTLGPVSFRTRVCCHFLLALIVCLWLGGAIWSRRRIPTTQIELPLLAVFASLILSTLLGEDPRRSAGWLGLLVVYLLWFYLVAHCRTQGWPAEVFMNSMLITGVVVVVLGLPETVGWWGALAQPLVGKSFAVPSAIRIQSLLIHGNILSCFLNLLLPLAVIRAATASRRPHRWAMAAFVGGDLVAQFFTSSRGGWIGTLVTVGTLAVLLARTPLAEPLVRLWGQRKRLFGPWRWVAVGLGLAVVAASASLASIEVMHPSHASILHARDFIWASAWSAFTRSPVYGTGPFTFSTEYLKHNPVPPFLDTAHSIPVNVAGEQGIVGLLVLGWLGVSFLRAFRGAWRTAEWPQQVVMAGSMAALTGFAVHGLFDDLLGRPIIGLTVAGILALALAAPARQVAPPARREGFSPLLLILPATLLIVGAFGSDWALRPFARGVGFAERGDWAAAARSFGLAADRDSGLAFYHFQAGYAWGRVASTSNSESALPKAIGAYEAGIRLEPNYPLNHANLAALYKQAGRLDEAREQMQDALESSPPGPFSTAEFEYGSTVFRRRGLQSGVLPQLGEGEITRARLEQFQLPNP